MTGSNFVRIFRLGLFWFMLTACSVTENEIEFPDFGKESRIMITINSTAFSDGAAIPTRYNCDGLDMSPDLTWENIPDGAESLALIMDDPDAPGGTWVHWIVFNMPVDLTGLAEDVGLAPGGGVDGNNSWRRTGYGGPCPPGGTHRYFFKLYALDNRLELNSGATKLQVDKAMEGHILSTGQLMGTYSR